jgi:hypothetical protein
MFEKAFRNFGESKRSRTLQELMALETSLPGGVEVTTEEAVLLLRNNATVRTSPEGDFGRVQKYFLGEKSFTWTGKSGETYPTHIVADAA